MIDLYRFLRFYSNVASGSRIESSNSFRRKKTKLTLESPTIRGRKEKKKKKLKKMEENVIEGGGGEKFHARIAFDKRLRISRARSRSVSQDRARSITRREMIIV